MSGCEQEAGEMVKRFHWPAEGLLADERQRVGVVNHDKTEGIWFRMNALTEIIHLVTNRVDTTVLFGAEPEDRFNRERGLLLQDFNGIFKKSCFSRAWGACDKDMGKIGHHFS